MDIRNSLKNNKKETYVRRTTNVVDLINRVKVNDRKEKRDNIIIAAVAISVLAVSGIIMSN